jgi:hypothetical protein
VVAETPSLGGGPQVTADTVALWGARVMTLKANMEALTFLE